MNGFGVAISGAANNISNVPEFEGKPTFEQELLEKCNLHTIVRLPNGVFAPYTGIKKNSCSSPKANPRRKSGITNTPIRRE